jgi:signal transduction histidine kinase
MQRITSAGDPTRRAAVAVLLAATAPAAFAAVEFSVADPSLAAWWPAAGLAVMAGMLARGRERWLVIPLVAVLTGVGNVVAGRDPLFAVLLGFGNAVEVVIIAALLAPAGVALRVASLRTALRFIVVVLVGAVGSGVALGAVASVFLERPFLEATAQLTASHAAATLVMLPLVLVPLADGRPVRALEVTTQSVALVALIAIVFWPGNDWPTAFVPLVAFLWAALRFSLIITAVQLVVTAFAVIILTTLGGGPFAVVDGDTRAPVVLIQIFLLVYAVTSLLIVGARTDWFQLIRRLQAQEEALRVGIVTADAGIVILDRAEGRLRTVTINPRARRALGSELPPYGVPELDAAVDEGRPARVEFERDGHVFDAVVTDTSTIGGADLVSIVVIDVTEREERERQAHELADELQRLNAQKDDFISAVSHELRTPVTSIIGFSEDLDDGRLPPDLAQAGEIIARNARRLADVIDDVLELSRLGALGGPLPEPADVDLVRLATECSADAEGLALDRGVRVEVSETTPPSLVVRSRERDLVRVCANIFSNAVKFSHEGGRVTVELHPEEGGGALVRVIDRGLGIPPEYREMVWQRFARAPIDSHRAVPGTGLGLPIVKALLESRLGGTARLLETPGGGTTVEVRLPAVAPAVSSPHAVDTPAGTIEVPHG